MWEVTIKHAKTCEIGHKWHIFRRRDDLSVVMNSICQVIRIENNGQVYSTREISYHFNRVCITSIYILYHSSILLLYMYMCVLYIFICIYWWIWSLTFAGLCWKFGKGSVWQLESARSGGRNYTWACPINTRYKYIYDI